MASLAYRAGTALLRRVEVGSRGERPLLTAGGSEGPEDGLQHDRVERQFGGGVGGLGEGMEAAVDGTLRNWPL